MIKNREKNFPAKNWSRHWLRPNDMTYHATKGPLSTNSPSRIETTTNISSLNPMWNSLDDHKARFLILCGRKTLKNMAHMNFTKSAIFSKYKYTRCVSNTVMSPTIQSFGVVTISSESKMTVCQERKKMIFCFSKTFFWLWFSQNEQKTFTQR